MKFTSNHTSIICHFIHSNCCYLLVFQVIAIVLKHHSTFAIKGNEFEQTLVHILPNLILDTVLDSMIHISTILHTLHKSMCFEQQKGHPTSETLIASCLFNANKLAAHK